MAWVVGVAVIAICIMPIIYFPMSTAWDQVEGTVTQNYTFTGQAAMSLMVVNLIISYLVGFGSYL